MRNKILITAVSGDIGSAAVHALTGSNLGIIGTDINAFTPNRDLLDVFYQAPPAKEGDKYIDFILNIIMTENVQFFLPISEPEIEIVNTKREQFDNLDVHLVINNKIIIDNFSDKLNMVRYLNGLNILAPQTSLLAEYRENLGYPIIIKPRKGCGGKRLCVAKEKVDIEYMKRKDDGSFIVQEYIGSEDEEYTTGVFSDGKKVSSITFRRKLGYGSLSKEAVLVEEPFLESLSEKLARATNLIGSINIQSRRANEKFIPFEINPRLSSTLLFRKRFGFDDVVWWVNVLLGKGYSYQKKYLTGRAIRCFVECYFDMKKQKTHK